MVAPIDFVGSLLGGNAGPGATAAAAASDPVVAVASPEHWATLLDGALPVVVDFHAPWCGPCKVLAPAFEALAAELAGRAVFAKVNIDAVPSVADDAGVSSLPTVQVWVGGRIAGRVVGANVEAVRALVSAHVLG